MMVSDTSLLGEMERRCKPVRIGDLIRIQTLAEPFIKKKRGFLTLLRNDDRRELDKEDLLASSEALLSLGLYRESISPLERLIRTSGRDHSSRDVAIARAGQIAIINELPMDLSPLVSEIGLSRRDLDSALMRIRSARGKRSPLADMEKALFQAMLLSQGASWVESDRLRMAKLRGALEGFHRSMELAKDIGDEYHICRCERELSRFLLDAGEYTEGIMHLERAEGMARESGFTRLLLEILILRGIYVESNDSAEKDLREAQNLSSLSRDSRSMAMAGMVLGSRQVRNDNQEGIDRIIHSARIIEELGDTMECAERYGEAALWSVRLGDPEKGISLAKEAYKRLKSTRDRESLTRILCILFFAYIRADSRTKAKKLLLEIVSEHPVKQFPEQFALLKEAVRDADWLREDRDTRDMFEEEMVYTISREAVEEIKTRAKEAYPNEFGAMLRGIEHITHIEPVMEGAANRSSFMFSMFSRFSQREIAGEGVVHSHPSGSANPSRADLSMFGRFPGINIIIAYPFEDDSMATYDRMGNRVKLVIEK